MIVFVCIELHRKNVRMVFGFVRRVQDCDRLQLVVERHDDMYCFCLFQEPCFVPFFLKLDSTLTLDHKGNLVTLARWFYKSAITRILKQVDACGGSLQWPGSLE